MLSRRTLGTVALGSLAVAAVSFAVVDQTTAISRACTDAAAACAHEAVPAIAVVFAVIGAVFLVIGIVPAIWWLILTIRLGHTVDEPDDDLESTSERHRRALSDDHD